MTYWLTRDHAHEIGRADLQIVPPHWLEESWRGRTLTGIVVDHAARLTYQEQQGLLSAQTRIR